MTLLFSASLLGVFEPAKGKLCLRLLLDWINGAFEAAYEKHPLRSESPSGPNQRIKDLCEIELFEV